MPENQELSEVQYGDYILKIKSRSASFEQKIDLSVQLYGSPNSQNFSQSVWICGRILKIFSVFTCGAKGPRQAVCSIRLLNCLPPPS